MPQVEPEYRILGDGVRRLRRERGMSQERLANEIDLSRSALANIEAGHQRVAFHQYLALAKALRVNPAELLPQQQHYDDLPLDEQLAGLGVPESAARAVARAVRTVMDDASRTHDRPRRKAS